MKFLFGNRFVFVVWHAFIGGLLAFWTAHISNCMKWISWPDAPTAFFIVLVVGGLIGWYHHPNSK